jgi:hypothetical protein
MADPGKKAPQISAWMGRCAGLRLGLNRSDRPPAPWLGRLNAAMSRNE